MFGEARKEPMLAPAFDSTLIDGPAGHFEGKEEAAFIGSSELA